MKRYLIIGASFRGRGAEVMILETYRKIMEIDKTAKISMATNHYKFDSNFLSKTTEAYNINVLNLEYNNFASKNRKICFVFDIILMFIDIIIININRIFSGSVKVGYCSKLAKYIDQSDIILQIAGISFTQKMGVPFAVLWTNQMLLSHFMGKIYICMPQSFGPSGFLIKRIAKIGLENAAFIMPRGHESIKYLNNLKLKNKNIAFVPDLSFAYRNPSTEESSSTYNKLSIDLSKKYIGILFNSHLYRWAGEDMIQLFAKVSDYLIDKYGYNIILIPLELSQYYMDDVYCNNLILASCKNKERIHNVTENLRANEIKSLIKLCDFTICARFHGMVFSLNMNVPPLVISWADKYKEIMELFGLDYLVIAYTRANIHDLTKNIDYIKNNKCEISNKIKSEYAEIKFLSEKVKDIIISIN